MEKSSALKRPDPLLLPFLEATSVIQAQQQLQILIRDHAETVIRAIIGRRLHGASLSGCRRQSSPERDAEDIHGETIVQLITRLQATKTVPDATPISNFCAYVAVATYHACDKHLHEKYPQRWSLRNRLRYLMTHQPGFALWETEGNMVCGFAAWRNIVTTPAQRQRLASLREDPRTALRNALHTDDIKRLPLAELVAAIFNRLCGPIELDDLLHIVATLLELQEITTVDVDLNGETDPYARIADPRADLETEVDQRVYLEKLWMEISLLPPRQCAALLLNLRDLQGRGVIALLPLTGVATLRQIAGAMDLSAEQFAALWNDLPLEDAAISQLLGVTRQQVINLRKVARERLARRIKVFEGLE